MKNVQIFRDVQSMQFVLLILLTLFVVPSLFSQVYFFEDFENWPNNIWDVSGQDWATTSVIYRSPTHSITDSPGGNYPARSNATLRLANPVDLSASDTPVLTFWHRYYLNTDDAFCYVEISKDGGFT